MEVEMSFRSRTSYTPEESRIASLNPIQSFDYTDFFNLIQQAWSTIKIKELKR